MNELEKYKKLVDNLVMTLEQKEEWIHDKWLNYDMTDETEEELYNYIKSMNSKKVIDLLILHTSMNKEESKEFINILSGIRDIPSTSIIEEYLDNWSMHNNYKHAWEDEQIYCDKDEQTEEEFKQHSFILSTGRCLVRDYK